jgi:hypothetical protein
VLTRAEGNFLYAQTVLDAVLDGPRDLQAVRARVDALIGSNAPTNLRDYWRSGLRQTIDYDSPGWREVYRPLLATLAVAKDAVSLSQLAGIIGRSRSDTADAIRTLRRFLYGEAEGPFRIFHTAFTDFLITTDEYGIDSGEAHQAVAKYFTDTYEDDWRQCDDLYALRYTIDHLTDEIRIAPYRVSRRPLEARLAGAVNADFVEAVLAHGLVSPLRDSLSRAVSVVSDSVQQRELNQWLRFVDTESTTFANWDRNERPALFAERWAPHVAERVKEINPATSPPAETISLNPDADHEDEVWRRGRGSLVETRRRSAPAADPRVHAAACPAVCSSRVFGEPPHPAVAIRDSSGDDAAPWARHPGVGVRRLVGSEGAAGTTA